MQASSQYLAGQLEPEEYLKMAFTKVFGVMQLQNNLQGFQSLHKYINKFILDHNHGIGNHSILANTEKKTREIAKKLSGIQSINYKIFSYFTYGCALIFEKVSPEAFTKIYIVFNQTWELDSSIIGSETLLFPVPTSQFNIFSTGTICNSAQLNKVTDDFVAQLNKVIKFCKEAIKLSNPKVKNHYTPSWLAQACRRALESMTENMDDAMLRYNISQGFTSKGGTYDVSKHIGLTKPDTVWCVSWAIIYYFAEDPELVKALMVDYQTHLLRKFTLYYLRRAEQINLSNDYYKKKSQMAASMRCLQLLRSEMQKLNGQNNFYYDNERACKQIKEIAQIIAKIDIPCNQVKHDSKNMGKHAEYTYAHLDINRLVPQISASRQVTQETMKNLSSTFLINPQFPITSSIDQYTPKSYVWIQAVEDTIFTFVYNQLKKQTPFKNLRLDIVKQSRDSQSKLTQLLQLYIAEMQKNYKQFGIVLQCQSHSHIELMKALICIIGFQIYKREKSQTIYSINEYRVPINILNLYNSFNSLSFKARKVMDRLHEYYLKNQKDKQKQNKINFFDQSIGYPNYKRYAEKVAIKSKTIETSYNKKYKQLQIAKEVLKAKINKFHQERNQMYKQLQRLKKKDCECYEEVYEEEEFISFMRGRQIVQKTRKIQCKWCKKIRQQNKIIKLHEQKRQDQIKTYLPKSDGKIHQFFYLLDDELDGLINLILYCQHEVRSGNPGNNGHRIFQDRRVRVFTSQPTINTFKLVDKKQGDVEQLTKYTSDEVIISWCGYNSPKLSYDKMNKDIDQTAIKSLYQSSSYDFLSNPISPPCNLKEHKIYSNIYQKSPKIKLEQYISVGSCRVGEFTQIGVCLEALLKRSIQVDLLSDDYLFKLYVVYRCFSSVKAYKPLELSSDIYENIENGSNYFLKYFLQRYYRNFSSEDFNSLPIIGPLISLISRILIKIRRNDEQLQHIFTSTQIDTSNTKIKAKKIIKKILSKVNKDYQGLQQDNKKGSQRDARSICINRANQCFIAFGGLCCFTELLINQKDRLAIDFVKMIVIMRFKEVYLELTKSQHNYAKTIHQFSSFKTKAIENNIKTVLKYFMKNPNHLTEVVKIVDENIDQTTKWTKDLDGDYVFKGQNKHDDTYKIDIKHGKVIKNGQTVSRIPEIFKKSPQYKKIFDDRDFEVNPSPQRNSIRTTRNFIDLFAGNVDKDDNVLFQFAYTGATTAINMIVRYRQKDAEEVWRLLNNDELCNMISIPVYYANQYYAWYNTERSCIVFRKPDLNYIGEVVLVAFVDQSERAVRKVNKIHVISKQHYRSHFDEICDPNKTIFDKLILRNREEKQQSLAISVLSRIEKKEYILQLESYEGTLRKFWLHRFDLMFIQDQVHGILPQNIRGYRISQNPYHNKYVPWSEKDKIRCLVFEKYVNTQLTQQLHQIKIILPNVPINEKGQLPFYEKFSSADSYYLYDIHDHFHDIRGLSRASQLYMASILAAINKNIKHPHLRITPMEYAIKIVKSCFGNCPLQWEQLACLKKIMSIALCQQNQSLLLLCFALSICAKDIQSLKQNKHEAKFHYQNTQFKDIISNAMNKYNNKLKENRLPYRQRLSQQISNIIGLKSTNQFISKGRSRSWRMKNKLTFDLPILAIETYLEQFSVQLKQWSDFNRQIMNNIDQQLKQKQMKKVKEFPLNIENPEDNLLLQQVTKQLQKSYDIYHDGKIAFNSIKIGKEQIKRKLREMKQKMQRSKSEIQKVINGIVLQNKTHVDIVSGISPVLSPCDYVNLLIQSIKNDCSKFMDALFPDLGKEPPNKMKDYLLSMIRIWILFSVKLDSCQRISNIIEQLTQQQDEAEADKIALFRECESPRQQIESRVYWICFEAQMKIQIWKSQYQTYKTLFLRNNSGSVCQLNMGQGKTQTIIPMMALELLYATNLPQLTIFDNQPDLQTSMIPRINFMESLLKESHINYFKSLSTTAFNIPLVVLPFDRKINFDNKQNLNSIIRSISYFKKKMIMILDQSSTHSLILKLRQETIKSDGIFISDKQQTIFKNMNVFDIFDQVDAQQTPKKSFIYSVGKSSLLDQSDFRFSTAFGLLQALCRSTQKLFQQKYVAFDETYDETLKSLQNGEFPKGYRLIANILGTEDKKYEFRKYLLSIFLQDTKSNSCQFFKALNPVEQSQAIEYVLKDSQSPQKLPKKIPESSVKLLLSLRGFLAYGVFQHCLSLRCNVNYGVPDEERKFKKRLSVPYQAADIPSKKNDYAHPDVAILLSYLSYYNFGVNEEEVFEGIQKLFRMTNENEDARQLIFKNWRQTLGSNQIPISKANQIKPHSLSQRQLLFKAFRMNRKFISFFLQNCIFSKDMAQFKESITSSSWDHANVKRCIGFSGTKDNCRLLPTYLKLVESDNQQIAATDGKMLDMLIQNVKQVKTINKGQQPLWQRFLNTIFSLNYRKVHSIIDAGALLASKPLKEHIVPFISRHKKFNVNGKLKGISFCSDNKWQVYKLSSQQNIERGTSIADNQTFVIFDEYRTRGADMKMDADIIAVLTLSPLMTKDALMQAVGRLRKIGRNQKLIILMTQQVEMKLKKFPAFKNNLSTEQKVKAILSWSCLNSVKQNQKYLLPNAKLANIHFKNIHKPESPYIDQSDTSLKTMYADPVTYKTVANLCQFTISQISRQQLKQEQKNKIQSLRKIYNRYGNKTKVKAQNFQEVCERQTEIVKEVQEQRQIETVTLSAIQQQDALVMYNLQEYHNFKFGDKIKLTQNFNKCTRSYRFQNNFSSPSNELMNSYFVLLSKNYICMITQRQVYRLLVDEGLPFYQIDFKQNSDKYIARFSDLSTVKDKKAEEIGNNFINEHHLEEALVYCKFFNGVTQYQTEQEVDILKNLLKSQQNKKDKIQHFLNLRKQLYKFKNSTLAQICRILEQMPQDYDENYEQKKIVIDRRALLRRYQQSSQEEKAEEAEDERGDQEDEEDGSGQNQGDRDQQQDQHQEQYDEQQDDEQQQDEQQGSEEQDDEQEGNDEAQQEEHHQQQ